MTRRRLLLVPVLALLTSTGTAALAAEPVPAATTSTSADSASTLPRAPTVRSQDYPEDVSSPARAGVLHFGAHGVPDVVRFTYDYTGDYQRNAVEAVDGAAQVTFTPTRSGPVEVFVHSINSAGVASAARVYRFSVTGHAGDLVAGWTLDDPEASREAVDAAAGRVAALSGGAHFEPGTGRRADWDATDGALALGAVGDGASTPEPLIDTSSAFTVLTWVRLANLTEHTGPSKDRPVLSVDGTVRPGMWLGYDADAVADDDPATRNGTFVMRMTVSDTAGARVLQVQADRDAVTEALDSSPFNANGYVNVAGMYHGGGRLEIFINGQSAGTTEGVRRDWRAAGPFRLGAGRYGASTAGSLDRVQVYSSALFDAEVQVAALAD